MASEPKITYLNDPNLKKVGVEYSFTQEQVDEYVKCKNDIIYFVETYMLIRHVDRGLIPFKLYDYQKRLLLQIQENRFSIALTPRQVGKSIVTIAFLLHYSLFNEYKMIGIIANKGATSRKILEKYQLAYKKLPFFLQQGVTEWNKGSLAVENGSSILTGSTTSDSIRGDSLSLLFVDEAAFIQNNLWDSFWKSVYPTISSGTTTKVVLVSTANGMNHYYKMWEDAINGRSKFVPFTIKWSDVPGRDEAWKAETIANTSEDDFRQEHNCLSGDVEVNICINTNVSKKLTLEGLFNDLSDL